MSRAPTLAARIVEAVASCGLDNTEEAEARVAEILASARQSLASGWAVGVLLERRDRRAPLKLTVTYATQARSADEAIAYAVRESRQRYEGYDLAGPAVTLNLAPLLSGHGELPEWLAMDCSVCGAPAGQACEDDCEARFGGPMSGGCDCPTCATTREEEAGDGGDGG